MPSLTAARTLEPHEIPTTYADEAMGDLYAGQLRHLSGMFRSKGVPPEEARDLAQETVLRTLQHLKRHGRTREDIGPLTRTIARNLLVERIRRTAPVTVSLSDEVDAPDEAPDPSEIALQSERREAVRAALGSLTPRHRRVIELWMQGQSPAEIARELGIKRNAADAILHRARRTLASRLGPKSLWSGIGLLWFRFKTNARSAADAVTSWAPDPVNLAPAGISLATVGLAAILSATSPAPATEAPTAPIRDAAPVVSKAPAPVVEKVTPSAKLVVPAAADVPEDDGSSKREVEAVGGEVTNPVDGEPDSVGGVVSYDPNGGPGRGLSDGVLDELLPGGE
jgi:RNA polymerase sigma factor (sigma-70 family)